MSLLGLILLILLAVFLFGSAPQWGWHERGYWPSGAWTVVLVIVLVLVLSGRL